MLCNNCGQENSNEAVFCTNCVHYISDNKVQTPPPLNPVNISKNAQISSLSSSENADTLLAAFVDEKYDSYYRDKWFKDSEPRLEINNNGSSIHSFNLAGFLFGVFWLCYRKMYKLAFFIMLAITVIDLILMQILGADSYNDSINYAFMGIWIGLTGFLGNYFYFDYSVKQIKRTTDSTANPDMLREQLAKKGGTSWVAAIGVGILLLAMSILVTYFFAPSWYWVE